jgi:hypothetical protein
MDEKQKAELKENKPEDINLHKSGEGFNLIAPQLEKKEKETKEKFKLDIRVVLFVFFIVLTSLGVVGYNWYISMTLDTKKMELEALREDLEDYRYTFEANNQVLERYTLYNRVQEGFISSKEVLTFWEEVSENLAEIRKIELSQGINFEVSGRADSLRDVTKLWHFLSIDDRVKTVTLEGVSIPVQDADDTAKLNFSFKGVLNLEYFNERK